VPIHDQGYRRYTGERMPPGRAWIVIARAGLRTFLLRRPLVGLLLVSWVPFLVRTIMFYFAANMPQMPFLTPTAATFEQFLRQQAPFVFFVTVYVGAGLIANDRRANALQLYLSKPVTRGEYVLGKVTILMAFILFITWVPAILLLVMQIAFAGNFTFFVSNLFLFPAITAVALLGAVVGATSMLALSTMSNNSRYVGVAYAALIFFSQALLGVVGTISGERGWSSISVPNALTQAGDVIFGQPLRGDLAWPVPFVVLAAVVALSGLILAWRVRGVEVVA
jgi:ABC-2 type transport system permease protein